MRSSRLLRWLSRTPVQTFILCPLLVVAFELVRQRGRLAIVPAGFALLAWGYLQYLLVGRFRNRLGGGGPGFGVPPDRIVEDGPYRYVRNPMYLGHLIFMLGLALTFASWFALILFAARALVSPPCARGRNSPSGNVRSGLSRSSAAGEALDPRSVVRPIE